VSHRDTTRSILDSLRRIVQSLRQPVGRRPHAGRSRAALGPARLFVLQSLADEPDSSLGELAAATRTDTSSVSVVVAQLVADGYVLRARAPADKRRLVLRLSAAGKRVIRDAPAAPQQRLLGALAALDEKRRARLATLLEELVAGLDVGGGAPALFFEDPPRRKR